MILFILSRFLDTITSLIAFQSSIYLESNPLILFVIERYGKIGFITLEVVMVVVILLLMRKWRLLRIAVNIFSVISIAVSLLNLYVLATV